MPESGFGEGHSAFLSRLTAGGGKKMKKELLTFPSLLSETGKAVLGTSGARPLLPHSGAAWRQRRQPSPKGRSRARVPRSPLPGEAALPGWV